MPDEMSETRTVLRLRTGSKICVLIALVLLVLAAYFFWTPLTLPRPDGGLFGCGSAANPPSDPFPKGVCVDLPTMYRFRALAALGSALLVGGVGIAFFGAEREFETRRVAASVSVDD